MSIRFSTVGSSATSGSVAICCGTRARLRVYLRPRLALHSVCGSILKNHLSLLLLPLPSQLKMDLQGPR